jgi:hypothetical protein
MSKQRNQVSQPAPHSWAIPEWPSHVYPHRSDRGRYLIRSNRTSLVQAGALTRVGRDLVVLGGPFSRWLESQSGRVDGFDIAPNRPAAPEHAAA